MSEENEVPEYNLKQEVKTATLLLDELNMLKESSAWILFQDELSKEYQKEFQLATTQEDAHKTKYHIERMKGIGFAMGQMQNIIIKLEDDIEHIKELIKDEEAGE